MARKKKLNSNNKHLYLGRKTNKESQLHKNVSLNNFVGT